MGEKVQTIKEIHHKLYQMFQKLYPSGEANALSYLLIGEYTGLDRARQLTSADEMLPVHQRERIMNAAQMVAEGTPWQYVIGYTEFCGYHLNVTPAVLIPRPETEELTTLIIDQNPGFTGTITDYCTGSGCIAIALAGRLPGSTVNATDVSEEALTVARHNAEENGIHVNFFLSDLLKTEPVQNPRSNIIVSNPPYVRESEKMFMRPNVLHHEPGIALFVTDDDPLLFYRKIADIARVTLCDNGRLYLEINEALGKDTAELFTGNDFKDVMIIKDLFGRDRFITAIKG